MSQLLTTRQVQNILQIDRTTVYRMLKEGRLTAVKVGNQWRFPQSEIDPILSATPVEEVSSSVSYDLLPKTCLQGMQNVSAEAMGISAMTTDTTGTPLTTTSNPSRFCQLIGSSETGAAACAANLTRLAHLAASCPQITCHAGLQCASTPIIINGVKAAVFIVAQYRAPQSTLDHPAHIQQLAETHQLDVTALTAAAAECPVVDAEKQQKIADWLPRLAHTLSEIGQERADLLGRLQRIAAISVVA